MQKNRLRFPKTRSIVRTLSAFMPQSRGCRSGRQAPVATSIEVAGSKGGVSALRLGVHVEHVDEPLHGGRLVVPSRDVVQDRPAVRHPFDDVAQCVPTREAAGHELVVLELGDAEGEQLACRHQRGLVELTAVRGARPRTTSRSCCVDQLFLTKRSNVPAPDADDTRKR